MMMGPTTKIGGLRAEGRGARGRVRRLVWTAAALLAAAFAATLAIKQIPLRHRVQFRVEVLSHFSRAPVLVIGDSITYQAAPRSLCGAPVFNAAVPANRLDDLLADAPALAARMKPERVVVAIGVNDSASPRTGIAEWEAKYLTLLSFFEGSELVLVEINPVDARVGYAGLLDHDFMARENAAIRAIAARTGARVVPAPAQSPTRDGLHPTSFGAALWRERLSATACSGAGARAISAKVDSGFA